jgi:hypothetical protein
VHVLKRITIAKVGSCRDSEILFLLAYACWLFTMVLSVSFCGAVLEGLPQKIVRYICILAIAIYEVASGRYTKKEYTGAVIALVFVLVLIHSQKNTWIDFVLFIYCARNINFGVLAEVSFYVIGLAFVVVVLCAASGVVLNYFEAGRNRWYLGFRYSLYPAQLLFVLTMLRIYIQGDGFSLQDGALLLFLNLIIYVFTDSRLSFILSVFAVVLALFVTRVGVKTTQHRFICGVLVLIFPIMAVFTIVITVLYNPDVEWMRSLNSVFGNRLDYGKSGVQEYGVTAFGQGIVFVGNGLDLDGVQNSEDEYNYIDCFFVKMLVQFGVLFLGLFLVLMVMACKKIYMKDNFMLLCLMGIIALHCVVDDLSMMLYFNPFLFLMACSCDRLSRHTRKYGRFLQTYVC